VAKIFKFKLDSLKKYREHRLLSAKKDMAEVLSRLAEIESQIKNSAIEARASMERAYDFSHGNVGLLTLEASLLGGELSKKRQFQEDLQRVEAELEKHREWVAHLAKELKAVDKLEEKQRERHDSTIEMREKRGMDAWVAERWPQYKLQNKIGSEAS